MKFYRADEIESLAESRLVELERELGDSLSPPIPIDLVGERILGLSFLWDEIEELPGETVLGAILPAERLIILNERQRKLLEEKPGLERSTKGHEMGHWDLFVDKTTLEHPGLFDDVEAPSFSLRSSPRGEVVVLTDLLRSVEGRRAVREIRRRADDPFEASAVNRYAAALSMPKELLKEEVQKINRTRWPELYRLREKFDVTITALVVRLRQLGLLHVTEDGQLFGSRHEAQGQMSLGL